MASKKQQSAKGKKQPKKAPANTLTKPKGTKPVARSARSSRFRMYRHILIPTDGSKLAHKAAVHALSLANALGARTTVLTVEPSFVTPTFAEHAKEWSALTASALNAIADEAKVAGVQCETVRITQKDPHEAIIAVATDRGCDLIVMGSHGQSGIIKMIVGSVTAKVVAQASVPVLVYHSGVQPSD
jgi:nucleotide-binding universal stress UspA family protein